MEINFFQVKPNIEKKVPTSYQEKPLKKARRVSTISCRVTNVCMKNEKANFYEVLSLASGQEVGFDEIKKAYRIKALELHPDVCPPSTRDESTQRFVELRKAYETLSDPNSRKVYDYELSVGGLDFCGASDVEKIGSVAKNVWERQLTGLKQRSLERLERKKNGYK